MYRSSAAASLGNVKDDTVIAVQSTAIEPAPSTLIVIRPVWAIESPPLASGAGELSVEG
jgi:hypothetical protein